MATHSSTLAWEMPRTEEPEGLQSTGSQRAGHELATEEQEDITIGKQMEGILSGAQSGNCGQKEGYLGRWGEVGEVKLRNGLGMGAVQLEKFWNVLRGGDTAVDGEWTSLVWSSFQAWGPQIWGIGTPTVRCNKISSGSWSHCSYKWFRWFGKPFFQLLDKCNKTWSSEFEELKLFAFYLRVTRNWLPVNDLTKKEFWGKKN